MTQHHNHDLASHNIQPPCQSACPVHQGCRDYLLAIATGDFDRALAIIKETNPLPFVCGTICAHHCEDESIKIESSQDFVVSGFTFNFENSHSFRLFSTSQLMLESPVAKNTSATGIFNYKKPPPQEVVLSQIQAFLI